MKASSILYIALAVLLLNAGITMMLINRNAAAGKPQSPSLVQASDNQRETQITEAVNAVEDAVVSVNVTQIQTVYGGLRSFGFFDLFGGMPMERKVSSLGSGVIYDPNGYIVTNAHVVSGAQEIVVVLPDKREFDAQLIGLDQQNDIAKLKINGSGLPYAELGSSQDVIIGEWAIALGNPFGLSNDAKPSVSVGVVSALNRSFQPDRRGISLRGMIQTDAAINPGNSGGPLVNIRGQVIGINTAIYSETGSNIGIGFAIPSDQVKRILRAI